MKCSGRALCLLSLLFVAQAVTAQTDAPRRLLDALPKDKTPEQILALLALNFGVEEFKTGAYDRAIHYLTESKRLDPELINARLYLATTYSSQYIPAVTSAENTQRAENAVQEFRAALQTAPENLSAIDGLGSILFQSGRTPFDPTKLGESKSLFRKHIQVTPKDPVPYYWIGTIAWVISWNANHALRTQFNDRVGDKTLAEMDPLPPDLRTQYAKELGPAIDEGIDCMQHALELHPDYDDAMTYLNLLFRRKADTVESPDERAHLLKMADDLIDKVKEIKAKRTDQPK